MKITKLQNICNSLRSGYVESGVDHRLDVKAVFSIPDRGQMKQQRISRAATDLAKVAPSPAEIRRIPKIIENNCAPDIIDQLEIILKFSIVWTDIVLQYPDFEHQVCSPHFNETIQHIDSGTLDLRMLENIGKIIHESAATVVAGQSVQDEIKLMKTVYPNDAQHQLHNILCTQIEHGRMAGVNKIQKYLEKCQSRRWTQEDLLLFDPYEFEHLIATLWQHCGYQTAVTKRQRDYGIDVIARTGYSKDELIQVKRFQSENPVGIAEVQRAGGLLIEFEVAKASLVTSSYFTDPALETAQNIRDVELIDGEQLCYLLNRSDLAPPLDIEQLKHRLQRSN